MVLFRWLLMHYALPIRAWLRQADFNSCGFGCGYMMESQLSMFCGLVLRIKKVWKGVLRLLVLIHANCVITWGVFRWGILEGQLLLYEKEDIVEAFHIASPLIQMVNLFY